MKKNKEHPHPYPKQYLSLSHQHVNDPQLTDGESPNSGSLSCRNTYWLQ